MFLFLGLSWELDFPKPYTFGHFLYTFMVVVSQVPVAQGIPELAHDDQVGQVLWLQVRNLLSRGEVRINAEHSGVLSFSLGMHLDDARTGS